MAMQAHVLEPLAAGHASTNGRLRGRPVWGPLDQPIRTEAGSLVVTTEGPDDVCRLAEVCGAPPTNVDGQLQSEIVTRLAAETASSWEARLLNAGLPAAVVASDIAALPRDARFSGLFEPLGGAAMVPASPWRFR
jgi:hypothetical protein